MGKACVLTYVIQKIKTGSFSGPHAQTEACPKYAPPGKAGPGRKPVPRPCAVLLARDGKRTAIGFLPLPQRLQKEKDWKKKGVWMAV